MSFQVYQNKHKTSPCAFPFGLEFPSDFYSLYTLIPIPKIAKRARFLHKLDFYKRTVPNSCFRNG